MFSVQAPFFDVLEDLGAKVDDVMEMRREAAGAGSDDRKPCIAISLERLSGGAAAPPAGMAAPQPAAPAQTSISDGVAVYSDSEMEVDDGPAGGDRSGGRRHIGACCQLSKPHHCISTLRSS